MKKPLFLSKEFFPATKDGLKPLSYYRNYFFEHNSNNLHFLLKKRYEWMADYITPEQNGIEIGAGTGLSKTFLSEYNYELTDCYEQDWIDRVVDAQSIPLEDETLDYILASNMIHHLSKPLLFFREANRTLKTGGIVLIQDVNSSYFMRLILKLLKHEGYSYDRNPFDLNRACNDPKEPWSGNNALIELLFRDKEKFEAKTGFRVELDRYSEFFIFLISGGVSTKFFTINLPFSILKFIHQIDKILAKFPKIFPLQRVLVLRKVSQPVS